MSDAEVVLALALGVLFTAGTFLVLRRDLVRVVFGVLVLSQATNVYLVTMGGIGGVAPILGHGGTITDPLVQALVLTAVVIGFATTALLLVLVYRTYQEHGSIDLDDIQGAVR
ncbi:multicomponent Na+:H+ antiporter subunit C [Halarchaeum rubridurum]|uniref:Multicomponent Na+:H+ antiporter subunit C n=1 Tax=Halarchaeum rubridurum TaxID=489911 RepID=A0A830G024_9EURY|nr:NADH-quinone oxidoreductase subunit K [Halarchaeum rubridurum]MBP1955136.1 multicomponent Na+:H+ antiporter subunit C [Halarchaeum rubridurum]GGM68655.1 Na(+)/H(+) antiporter subunit C [Halarchaeum rubridurum]